VPLPESAALFATSPRSASRRQHRRPDRSHRPGRPVSHKVFTRQASARWTPRTVFADGDCLLLDGTFWTDDEMIRLGLSTKTARDIGHLPQSGADGMIALLGRYASRARC
jgi:hypothetical protein